MSHAEITAPIQPQHRFQLCKLQLFQLNKKVLVYVEIMVKLVALKFTNAEARAELVAAEFIFSAPVLPSTHLDLLLTPVEHARRKFLEETFYLISCTLEHHLWSDGQFVP